MKDLFETVDSVRTDDISCPSCGHEFDIEAVIEKRLEGRIRKEYLQKYEDSKKKLSEKEQQLERERLEVKQLSAQTWEIIQEKLKQEKLRLHKQLEEQQEEEADAKFQELSKALAKQREENLVLKRAEVQLMQKEQELLNLREEEAIKWEKELLRRQKDADQVLRTKMGSELELIKVEYEKRIADQKKLVETMTRKIEQGSMKMQGEVQELAIEDFLTQQYRSDEVVPIKAGARGGDCLLQIRNTRHEDCGSIYFESKRTQHFQPAWIEKFRSDLLLHRAELGILVTQAMPSGHNTLTQIDGIWVCHFDHYKHLVPVLRSSLIDMHELRRHQDFSHDKMGLIYTYLISSEFRLQVEAIVQGFTTLREDLEKEKRAMHSIWKRREKQLEKVTLNTVGMYGSIKGIAGSDVAEIDALRLEIENTEE